MLGLRGVRLGPDAAGPVRAPGAGDRRGDRAAAPGRAATRGRRSWCRSSGRCGSCSWSARRPSACWRRSARRPGVPLDVPIGCMIELPARGADRAPHRRGGRLLLVRHQRPDADHVGLLARRRRARVLRRLPAERGAHHLPVRDARRRRGRCAGPRGRRGRPGDEARSAPRRLRRARGRPRVDPLLPRRRAWTTCRARRSGSRSPGWRPVGRPCRAKR